MRERIGKDRGKKIRKEKMRERIGKDRGKKIRKEKMGERIENELGKMGNELDEVGKWSRVGMILNPNKWEQIRSEDYLLVLLFISSLAFFVNLYVFTSFTTNLTNSIRAIRQTIPSTIHPIGEGFIIVLPSILCFFSLFLIC